MIPYEVGFGEVVASTLTSWTVQSWQLGVYPAFGTLVEIDCENAQSIGIIIDIQTHPKDSARTPFAFGKTLEELHHEQPHIFHLLQTTLFCVPLAVYAKPLFVYEIPKKPVSIHSFARSCPVSTIKVFFSESAWMMSFFNLLRNTPLFDELLLAIIRYGYEAGALTPGHMGDIIDTFSLLTHDNYRTLKIFLQRIELFIQQ